MPKGNTGSQVQGATGYEGGVQQALPGFEGTGGVVQEAPPEAPPESVEVAPEGGSAPAPLDRRVNPYGTTVEEVNSTIANLAQPKREEEEKKKGATRLFQPKEKPNPFLERFKQERAIGNFKETLDVDAVLKEHAKREEEKKAKAASGGNAVESTTPPQPTGSNNSIKPGAPAQTASAPKPQPQSKPAPQPKPQGRPSEGTAQPAQPAKKVSPPYSAEQKAAAVALVKSGLTHKQVLQKLGYPSTPKTLQNWVLNAPTESKPAKKPAAPAPEVKAEEVSAKPASGAKTTGGKKTGGIPMLGRVPLTPPDQYETDENGNVLEDEYGSPIVKKKPKTESKAEPEIKLQPPTEVNEETNTVEKGKSKEKEKGKGKGKGKEEKAKTEAPAISGEEVGLPSPAKVNLEIGEIIEEETPAEGYTGRSLNDVPNNEMVYIAADFEDGVDLPTLINRYGLEQLTEEDIANSISQITGEAAENILGRRLASQQNPNQQQQREPIVVDKNPYEQHEDELAELAVRNNGHESLHPQNGGRWTSFQVRVAFTRLRMVVDGDGDPTLRDTLANLWGNMLNGDGLSQLSEQDRVFYRPYLLYRILVRSRDLAERLYSLDETDFQTIADILNEYGGNSRTDFDELLAAFLNTNYTVPNRWKAFVTGDRGHKNLNYNQRYKINPRQGTRNFELIGIFDRIMAGEKVDNTANRNAWNNEGAVDGAWNQTNVEDLLGDVSNVVDNHNTEILGMSYEEAEALGEDIIYRPVSKQPLDFRMFREYSALTEEERQRLKKVNPKELADILNRAGLGANEFYQLLEWYHSENRNGSDEFLFMHADKQRQFLKFEAILDGTWEGRKKDFESQDKGEQDWVYAYNGIELWGARNGTNAGIDENTRHGRWRRRLVDIFTNNNDWIRGPSVLNIARNTQIDGETGQPVYDPATVNAMTRVANMYGGLDVVSLDDVSVLVKCYLGLAPDVNGQVCGIPQAEFRLDDNIIQKACQDIERSQRNTGLPMTLQGQGIILGNTRCYPMGYVPADIVERMVSNPNSILYGYTAQQVAEGIAQEYRNGYWVNGQMQRSATRGMMLNGVNNVSQGQLRSHEFAMASLMVADGAQENDIRQLGIDLDAGTTLYEQFAQSVLPPNSEWQEVEDVAGAIDNRDTTAQQQMNRLQDRNLRRIPNSGEPAPTLFQRIQQATQNVRQALFGQQGPELDDDGNVREPQYENERPHQVSDFFSGLTSWERFLGILDPTIITYNLGEHIYGSQLVSFANVLNRNIIGAGLPADVRRRFVPTEYLNEMCNTQEGKNFMVIANMLYAVGGKPAFQGFFASHRGRIDSLSATGADAITIEEAKRWLNEYVNGYANETEQMDPGTAQRRRRIRVKEMTDTLSRWSDQLMSGAGITNVMDGKRLIQAFLVNQLNNMQRGEPYVDALMLEKAIQSQGYTTAMAEAMARDDGYSAYISINNLSMGRISPLSAVFDDWLKNHGIINFFITTFICKYPSYGVRFLENFFPMSNTFSYLALRGLDRARVNGHYMEIARESQLGYGEARGLQKCIIYDLVKLGNTSLIALFWFALHCALGTDDDDEPDAKQRLDWKEWAFGSCRIVPSWAMNDMVGWGLAMGTSLYSYSKTGDRDLAADIFINGTFETFDGTLISDVLNLVVNVQKNADIVDKWLNGDYTPPKDWQEDNYPQFIWDLLFQYQDPTAATTMFLATGVSNLTTPAFLKNYMPGYSNESIMAQGENKYARTASKLYSGEPGDHDRNDTVTNENLTDVMLRNEALKSPTLGVLLNILNGKGFSAENEEGTGYMAWQMPFSEKVDPMSQIIMDEIGIPAEEAENMSPEEVVDAADHFEHWFKDHYGKLNEKNLNQAIANGFILPSTLSDILRDVWWMRSDGEEYRYLLDREDGQYYSEEEWNANYAKRQYYRNLKNLFVFNETVPKTFYRYRKLRTSTESEFYSSSGEGMNALEYYQNMITGDKSATREYLPTGNRPFSLSPFTTVENTNAYNEETPTAWYIPGVTDPDKVLEAFGNKEIQMGQEGGQKLGPTIAGSQDILDKDENAYQRVDSSERLSSDYFTINKRSYEPYNQKLEYNKDTSYELVLDRMLPSQEDYEEDKDDDDNETYPNGWNKDEAKAAERTGLLGKVKPGGNYADLVRLRNKYYNNNGGGGWSKYKKGGYGYGGGYRRRSYGGGGSSWSPRIYSSNQRIYANRAQGMNTRAPYKATTTYLRPGFATKGSREAWRRQDI